MSFSSSLESDLTRNDLRLAAINTEIKVAAKSKPQLTIEGGNTKQIKA